MPAAMNMPKVLIVDSNPYRRQRIASGLSSGFEVLTASAEKEALNMAEEFSPDAIVVRDSSPQLDGFKLCQQIRNLFDLPLILLRDKPDEEVYTPDMKMPSDWDYYIHWPVDYGVLAARIKVLLWRYGKGEKPGSRSQESGVSSQKEGGGY
jgi:DNA-binding response OmpR family regulator